MRRIAEDRNQLSMEGLRKDEYRTNRMPEVPDEYTVLPVTWECRNCDSVWDQVVLHPSAAAANGERRVRVFRLLHADESCPCYGRLCECGELIEAHGGEA